MDLFALCIFVNVLLGVIFKLFPKYDVDNLQAITINYFVSSSLGVLALGSFPTTEAIHSQAWFPYALFLSITFIIGFNVTALAFQIFGITFTTIVQKMSLIIPVSVAILYFGESSGFIKIFGIILALLSIILINLKTKDKEHDISQLLKKYWFYPAFTLIMSGVVELILLIMEKNNVSDGNDLDFVTLLFGMAGILGVITIIVNHLRGKAFKFNINSLYAGIILGIPNFFTIYFLISLLKKWDGSIVFPINNVGILAVSALVAVFLFNEKINRNRQIGLALAIISIYLISQF